MIKLVIFDLDGTLLNTIDDLADCTNYVLQKYGYPTHEVDAYKYFVGSGVVMLLKRALPEDIPEKVFENIHKDFMHHYEIHKENKTKPYDGMVETLEKLRKKGILLAIATNKPQEMLPNLLKHYFPTIHWAAVFGNRKDVPVKPNPQIIYDILKATQIGKQETLYIGDTAVDMETAHNAGIIKVGALWGFRTKIELKQAHADFMIKKPQEMIRIIFKTLS